MANSSAKPPPLLGPLNKKYLAYAFGSADGTIEGIADKYERARCEARIRFQERAWANWRHEVATAPGSIDEGLARIRRRYDEIENRCADLIKRPLLLRAKRAELLEAFPEKKND